jgi:hypothetical protein
MGVSGMSVSGMGVFGKGEGSNAGHRISCVKRGNNHPFAVHCHDPRRGAKRSPDTELQASRSVHTRLKKPGPRDRKPVLPALPYRTLNAALQATTECPIRKLARAGR